MDPENPSSVPTPPRLGHRCVGSAYSKSIRLPKSHKSCIILHWCSHRSMASTPRLIVDGSGETDVNMGEPHRHSGRWGVFRDLLPFPRKSKGNRSDSESRKERNNLEIPNSIIRSDHRRHNSIIGLFRSPSAPPVITAPSPDEIPQDASRPGSPPIASLLHSDFPILTGEVKIRRSTTIQDGKYSDVYRGVWKNEPVSPVILLNLQFFNDISGCY
jgi:hypothetical protein